MVESITYLIAFAIVLVAFDKRLYNKCWGNK